MDNKIATLKTEYRDLAIAHGRARGMGNYKSANTNGNKLIQTLKELKSFGPAGELALLSLVEDQDDSVACWAATHSLPFDEKHSLTVLGNLSKKSGAIGFDAKMVLQQWQKGQLIVP